MLKLRNLTDKGRAADLTSIASSVTADGATLTSKSWGVIFHTMIMENHPPLFRRE